MNFAEVRAMSEMDLNIAVAERCGYLRKDGLYPHGEPCWVKGRALYMATEVPDYCNDLNAMHEAEGLLVEVQKRKYGNVLMDVTHPDEYYGEYDVVHASARQRAEALLMTMGDL